jgi:hypothetical protein
MVYLPQNGKHHRLGRKRDQGGDAMPQILVMTDAAEKASKEAPEDREVIYRERVVPSDLESDHFSAQLVERVGWAVLDADERENQP